MSRQGVRAAATLAALGATALWPVLTQPASAAPPVRQAMAPPAQVGSPHAGPLHAGPAPAGSLLGGPIAGARPVTHAKSSAVRGTARFGTPAARSLPARAAAPETAAASAALGPAALAHGSVWDHVAMCESSGDWHINTGNGFYGGLQFWQPTWKRFGGGKFARRADLATRGEQITIAQSVLRAQGWQAWPVCSRKLGLHGNPADGMPSGGGTPKAGTGTGTGSGSAAGGGSGTAGGTAAGGGSASGSTASGSTAISGTAGRRHTVIEGETLAGIARQYHVSGGWPALYEANRSAVGPDPDRVLVGTVLVLP